MSKIKPEILFNGTNKTGNVQNLVFIVRQNNEEKEIKVPIDDRIAQHILLHLEKHIAIEPRPVEYGNDVPSL